MQKRTMSAINTCLLVSYKPLACLPLAKSAACTLRYELVWCAIRQLLDSCHHRETICFASASLPRSRVAPCLQHAAAPSKRSIATPQRCADALHALIIGHRAYHGRDAVAPGGNQAAAHGAREPEGAEGRISGRCCRTSSLLDVLSRVERWRS